MSQITVTTEGKDYSLRTGGEMSLEAQSESVDAELVGFEEDGGDLNRVYEAAKTNSIPEVPQIGGGTYIAVNHYPDGKAALIWKYLNGGNPDTSRWFPQ